MFEDCRLKRCKMSLNHINGMDFWTYKLNKKSFYLYLKSKFSYIGSILNFRYFIGESLKIWIKFITAKRPQSKRAISRFLADFKLLLKVLSSTKNFIQNKKP